MVAPTLSGVKWGETPPRLNDTSSWALALGVIIGEGVEPGIERLAAVARIRYS